MIFYITFGQRYRHESHSKWVNTITNYIHPDGYWEVEADSIDEARDKTFNTLGSEWSNIYKEIPEPDVFPLGSIGFIN